MFICLLDIPENLDFDKFGNIWVIAVSLKSGRNKKLYLSQISLLLFRVCCTLVTLQLLEILSLSRL